MKYFRDREDPKVEVPRDFMQRFLEVCPGPEFKVGT